MPRSNKNARSNKNSKLRLKDLTPKQKEKYGKIAKKLGKGFTTLRVAEFELEKARVYKINTKLGRIDEYLKIETAGIQSLTKEEMLEATKHYKEINTTGKIPIHRNLKLTLPQIIQATTLEKERAEALAEQHKKVSAKQLFRRGEAVPGYTVGKYGIDRGRRFDEYYTRERKLTEFANQEEYFEHVQKRMEQKEIGFIEVVDRQAKENYLKGMLTKGFTSTQEGRELFAYINGLPLNEFIEIFTTEMDASIKEFLYSGEDVREKIKILRDKVWKIGEQKQ